MLKEIALAQRKYRLAHGAFGGLEDLGFHSRVAAIGYSTELRYGPNWFRVTASPGFLASPRCCCALGMAHRSFYIDETMALRSDAHCRIAGPSSHLERQY
jgi:hypothetical protein